MWTHNFIHMLTYKYYNFRHITVKSVPNPTNTSSFFKNKFHKIWIFTPLQLILLLTKDTKDFLKYLENSQILTDVFDLVIPTSIGTQPPNKYHTNTIRFDSMWSRYFMKCLRLQSCEGIAVIGHVQMVDKTIINCQQGCGNWCAAMLLGVLDAYLSPLR